MSKAWNVRVDDTAYTVKLKGSKVLVNNEEKKLKECVIKKGWFQTDYEVNVGSKQALLVISSLIGGTKLVIDGKDCATGEEYVANSVPKWAYVFMVLHLINFMNGALGVLIAIVGCSITASISANRKFNTLVKILLDLVVLVLAYVVIFAIALALVV